MAVFHALFADAVPVNEEWNVSAADGTGKETGVEENYDRIHYIDINDIRPNSAQPRIHFDEEKLAELASSIRTNGAYPAEPRTMRPPLPGIPPLRFSRNSPRKSDFPNV